jgi:hypothetical protein
MSIATCPTDILTGTPEQVWELLVRPEKLAAWSGSRLISGPGRPLEVGDHVVLGPGFGMRATLDVLGMAPPREFRVDAGLPFGVVNHEVVEISPVGPGRCRVTLN